MATAVTVVLVTAGCGAEAQELPQRPNIIFILADDIDAALADLMPVVSSSFL